MKLQPPPGGAKISDWVGLRVRSVRSLRNGHAELPAGTEYTVGYAGRSGIHMASARCKACGSVQRISNVSHDDVEVLSVPEVIQIGIPGLEIPDAKPLGQVVEDHCVDLDRTASDLERLFPGGEFAKTAAEFRLAVRELRDALAAEGGMGLKGAPQR